MLSVKELRTLSSNGAGLILDARGYSPDDLIALVGQAGGTITLKHVADLSFEQLKKFLTSAAGEVVFDTTP